MENFYIRRAQISDAAFIIEYLKKVMSETNFLRKYPDEVKITLQEEESFIQTILEQENSILLVAFDGDLVVSMAGVQGQQLRKFRHCGEFGISVLKNYWGRGIGKEMTRKIIHWSQLNPELKKLILHVNAENETAIKMYRKFGFIQEGLLKNDFYYEGRFVDTLMMCMMV